MWKWLWRGCLCGVCVVCWYEWSGRLICLPFDRGCLWSVCSGLEDVFWDDLCVCKGVWRDVWCLMVGLYFALSGNVDYFWVFVCEGKELGREVRIELCERSWGCLLRKEDCPANCFLSVFHLFSLCFPFVPGLFIWKWLFKRMKRGVSERKMRMFVDEQILSG